jgi:hypothetical protein
MTCTALWGRGPVLATALTLSGGHSLRGPQFQNLIAPPVSFRLRQAAQRRVARPPMSTLGCDLGRGESTNR